MQFVRMCLKIAGLGAARRLHFCLSDFAVELVAGIRACILVMNSVESELVLSCKTQLVSSLF